MTDKSYSLTITKEQLAELPRVEFPGVIKVVNTAAEARKAVSILKNILSWLRHRIKAHIQKRSAYPRLADSDFSRRCVLPVPRAQD